ncbi:MAG: hypothetical protein ACRCZ2_00410 [Fusobacteriaceae bacterium]
MKLKAYYGSLVEGITGDISLKKIYSRVVENLEINIEFILGEKIPYCFIMDKTTKQCLWEDYVSKDKFQKILENPGTFLSLSQNDLI